MRRIVAAGLLFISAGSCSFEPRPANGTQACEPGTQACPPGYLCQAGYCWQSGSSSGITPNDSVTLFGRVTNIDGMPVTSGTVTSGGAMANISSDGTFVLDSVVPQSRLPVTAQSVGYAPQVLVVHPTTDIQTQELPISLAPLQIQNVDPAVGATLSLQVGTQTYSVEVPPNTIDAPSTVTVRVASIPPETGTGGMESDDGVNEGKSLQTAGTFYVDAVDPSGHPVTIKQGAGINFQTPPFSMQSVPQADAIDRYELDSARGIWVKKSALSDPATQGLDWSLSTFGFTSASRNFRTACVKGRLASKTNSARNCAGQHVTGIGPAGTAMQANSKADGSFCVAGPQGSTSSLHIGSQITQVSMPSSAGDCQSLGSCTDVGTLSVNDAECVDGAKQVNVTDGRGGNTSKPVGTGGTTSRVAPTGGSPPSEVPASGGASTKPIGTGGTGGTATGGLVATGGASTKPIGTGGTGGTASGGVLAIGGTMSRTVPTGGMAPIDTAGSG
jgi:hypothetical protein